MKRSWEQQAPSGISSLLHGVKTAIFPPPLVRDLHTQWQIEDKRIESRNPSRERGSNLWSISFPLRLKYDGWKWDSNFVQGSSLLFCDFRWRSCCCTCYRGGRTKIGAFRYEVWFLTSCVMSSYLSTSLPWTLQKSVRLSVTHFECECRIWKTPMRRTRTCTIN